MVSAMMSEALTPVLRDVSEVRARIIGIDGNGTGRKGALQRQDDKMEEIAETQREQGMKLDTLLHRSSSWDKKTVWRNVKWMFGIILTALGLMFAWLEYRAHTHPSQPIATGHAEVEHYDAGVQ